MTRVDDRTDTGGRADPLPIATAPDPRSSAGRWMVLLAAFLGWMFDGVEQGLFGLTARPALTEMLGPAAKEYIGTGTAVLVAVFLVGAAWRSGLRLAGGPRRARSGDGLVGRDVLALLRRARSRWRRGN